MFIELVILPNYLILYCLLLLLPSIFPIIRVFSNESALHIRWPKFWSFHISLMSIQGSFSLGSTGLMSLQSKGLTRVFSRTTIRKHQFFHAQPSLWSNFHIYTWLLEKKNSFDYMDIAKKWCLCFLICCLGVYYFPSKEQRSFNFIDAVTICNAFGAQEKKICHCFQFFLFYLLWSDRTGSHDLSFINVEFQARLFTLLFHPHQEAL